MIAFIQGIFDTIIGLLNEHGYLITLLGTTLENLFLIGSFTPGETIVAASAFTAATEGGITVWGVWLSSFVGTCLGTSISFVLGVRGGRAFLEGVERRSKRLDGTLDAAEAYFEKHGSKSLFLARFVAVFKNVTPVVAGASRMRWPVFLGYTALGAATYTSIMCAVGWFFGENFQVGLQMMAALGWVGFVIVVGGFAVAWWGKRRYTARRIATLEAEHEAAHPHDVEPGDPRSDDPEPHDLPQG